MSMRRLSCALLLVAAGCSDPVEPRSSDLADPLDLTYQLIPSGFPEEPSGILLSWIEPNDSRVASYVIYSRASTSDQWSRRAETTSSTFHDAGFPHLQYFVASVDEFGDESSGSNVITVDERNRLPAPTFLGSISLDGAIQLAWPANARTGAPDLFDYYRVYSTVYDLDANICEGDFWVLEGTTVSEDFLATGLANGAPRCFAVSTVSRDGHESLWTSPRADTPRYDARNVLIDAVEAVPATSGFLFDDGSSFGVVTSGTRTDIDFRVERDPQGGLLLAPVRSDVQVALYSDQPVTDLTSIDIAPETGFDPAPIEAVPGYAYVFAMTYADGLHFGAVRVTHVGSDYLILDWAYQSDRGNPELQRLAEWERPARTGSD
ncbi:MAG: hypothetical protein ACRENI_09710 [Gemmatimonadaceae bacterium]